MKSWIITCVFGIMPLLVWAQPKLEQYTYGQFIHMITTGNDSVFELNDVVIYYDSTENNTNVTEEFTRSPESASMIVVDKKVVLKNMILGPDNVLHHFQFKKDVTIENCGSVHFNECVFDLNLHIVLDEALNHSWIDQGGFESWQYYDILLIANRFRESVFIEADFTDEADGMGRLFFEDNRISIKEVRPEFDRGVYPVHIRLADGALITITYNEFNLGDFSMMIELEEFGYMEMNDNKVVSNGQTYLAIDAIETCNVFANSFSEFVVLDLSELDENDNLDWDQFDGKLINAMSLIAYYRLGMDFKAFFNAKNLRVFASDSMVQNTKIYNHEMALRGKLYSHFENVHNRSSANSVFIEMKNLETARLAHLYRQSPDFNGYFRLQLNRFLRLFSSYGTDPAKSMVYAVYIILLFAGIYLFFPSSWNDKGQNRLMNRFQFFMTYMSRNDGLDKVYLDKRSEELKAFEAFNGFIRDYGHSVPPLFRSMANSLYRWSVSTTNLTAFLLSKVDVLQGTWSKVPKNRKLTRGTVLLVSFTLAILFDLTVKVLNALMLSLNMFTTLGFGHIPIAGVTRYLAIIEGFVGWFVLSIFSVSLISQLLQ